MNKTREFIDINPLTEKSLSILDRQTIEDIQEFVDMDLSGWTFTDETGEYTTETIIETEPDWKPEI